MAESGSYSIDPDTGALTINVRPTGAATGSSAYSPAQMEIDIINSQLDRDQWQRDLTGTLQPAPLFDRRSMYMVAGLGLILMVALFGRGGMQKTRRAYRRPKVRRARR